MMEPDEAIVAQLKLIDPGLEVEFVECKKGSHDFCRIEFSRRRACNRWVVYRRVSAIPGVVLDRWGETFFGKEWKGPVPTRIPVLVWEDPFSKKCGHACGDPYDVVALSQPECCWCVGKMPVCNRCKDGPQDGYRPLDARLPKFLLENDTYRKFRDEAAIDNLVMKQMEIQVRMEHRLLEDFMNEYRDKFVHVLSNENIAYDLLNLPPQEAAKRFKSGDYKPKIISS